MATITAMADGLLLVLLILAGRFLDVQEFGLLTVCLAAGSVFALLLNFGLDAHASRGVAVAPGRADEIVGRLLVAKVLMAALLTPIVALGIALATTETHHQLALAVFLTAALGRSFNLSLRALLRSLDDFSAEAAIVGFERLLTLGLATVILLSGGDALALGFGFLIARVSASALFFRKLRALVPKIRWPSHWWRAGRYQLDAVPMGIGLVMIALYFQADVLLLSALSYQSEVGLFGAAVRVFEGLWAFPMMLETVLYPRLSSIYKEQFDGFTALTTGGVRYVLLLGVPLAAAAVPFADPAIVLVYGQGYASSGILLMWLLCGIAFLFATAVLMTASRAAGRQLMVVLTMAMGLAVKLALGLTLIPETGAVGAAQAAFASAGAVFVTAFIQSHDLVNLRELLGKGLRICIVAGIAVVCAYGLSGFSPAVAAVVAAASYFMGLAVSRCLEPSEWRAVRQFVAPAAAARLTR